MFERLTIGKNIVNLVACCMWDRVTMWGKKNNWKIPIKRLFSQNNWSIELLDSNLFLRGGERGKLKIMDLLTGNSLQSIPLHSYIILHIAKNIVVTVSDDRSVKIIDPLTRKCYLIFNDNLKPVLALTKCY